MQKTKEYKTNLNNIKNCGNCCFWNKEPEKFNLFYHICLKSNYKAYKFNYCSKWKLNEEF
jgi:hypothetical protein